MAKDVNKVTFTGKVFNPKFETFGDKSKMTFTLGIDDSYKPKDKDWVNKTIWKNVELWGKQAESYQTLQKFDYLLIEGKLRQDNYEKDGQKRQFETILPDKIKFIEDKKPQKLNIEKEDAIKVCRNTGCDNQEYNLTILFDNYGSPQKDEDGDFVVIDSTTGEIFEKVPF